MSDDRLNVLFQKSVFWLPKIRQMIMMATWIFYWIICGHPLDPIVFLRYPSNAQMWLFRNALSIISEETSELKLGGKKSILKFFQNRSEKKVNPETKNHIFKGKKILWHSILQKQKYLLRQTVHIFPPNCFVYFPLFFAHCVGILSAKTILAYFKTS